MSGAETFRLRWRDVETKEGWQVGLLPIAEYPLQQEHAAAVSQFCAALGSVLRKQYQLIQQVALQVWRLGPETGGPELQEHRSNWRLQLGLGVWPDRVPPQGWKEECMVDAAAAIYRGDEPELPFHRLLRVGSRDYAHAAAQMMHRHGVALELFARKDRFQTDTRFREIFLSRITEHRFRNESFYLPLLDRNSVLRATNVQALDTILEDVEVYLRDSAEDRGLLLISRLPLVTLFQEVQSCMEDGL